MAEENITLIQAVEKAIEKMRPIRRAATKFRMRNPTYREQVLAELRLKLTDDDDVLAMMGTEFAFGLADETFQDDTPFSINPDNLEKFLQIILKYLPQILDIILKLFV